MQLPAPQSRLPPHSSASVIKSSSLLSYLQDGVDGKGKVRAVSQAPLLLRTSAEPWHAGGLEA